MFNIGKLKLKSRLILSPMAGITDLPFRMLNRDFGCELAFIEMLNVRSVSHKSRRTLEMLSTRPKDRPLGAQLLGCESKYILKGLEVLAKYKFDVLDFNAACPAKKVVRRGEGAALLKEPKKLSSLLKLIVENSQIPVTVKIRTGWDKDSVNAGDIALLVQDCGADALFIHGRTKTQGYSGNVDYKIIKQVKNSLRIPVIASGDIFSPVLAKKMFDETGCDALAVARGALGNPWIFEQIEKFLKAGAAEDSPDMKEIVRVMRRHLSSNIDFFGERIGVMKFRKFFIWYTKGFKKIRHLREEVSRAKTKDEMCGLIKKSSQKNPNVFGVLL